MTEASHTPFDPSLWSVPADVDEPRPTFPTVPAAPPSPSPPSPAHDEITIPDPTAGYTIDVAPQPVSAPVIHLEPPLPPPRPSPPPDRRTWIGTAALVLALVVALAVPGWLFYRTMSNRIDRERSRVAALNSQLDLVAGTLDKLEKDVDSLTGQVSSTGSTSGDLTQRLADLEEQLGRVPDVTALVKDVQPSVFTIEAGDFLGTGFVASSNGGSSILVTNFHVVSQVWNSGEKTVTVVKDNDRFDGRILEVKKGTDLAAIKVERVLPALDLVRSLPDVGTAVLVFGSPEGLEGTVTTGIVSAIRDGFIQFSAPVSPGNSGGPVVDYLGHVIGMTESKIVEQGAEGLSFAIPSGRVCTMVAC
jgi:S1-C subfamily serine protease